MSPSTKPRPMFRLVFGETGAVGSAADSIGTMRRAWADLPQGFSTESTCRLSAATHASASCWASRGVEARALILMSTVSSGW